MPSRTYGQYCGLARALELVGERWALLIIRDLLVGPRRFTDLRRGLPRIPSNVLSDRLKELERDGIVQRRILPRPASATVYGVVIPRCVRRYCSTAAKAVTAAPSAEPSLGSISVTGVTVVPAP